MKLEDERRGFEQRRQARADLKRAQRPLRVVRFYFGVLAVFQVGLTAVTLRRLSTPELAAVPVTVEVAVSAVLLAVIVAGWVQLPYRPLAWTLALALLKSADAAFRVVDVGVGPQAMTHLVVAVGLWAALPAARRARDLQRELAELGADAPRGRRASEHATARADRRARVAAGIVLAVVGAGAWLVLRDRPGDVEAAAGELIEAWQASDLERIDAMFTSGADERRLGSLRRLAQRRGWDGGLPAIEDAVTEPFVSGFARTELRTPEGAVIVHWAAVGGAWRITSLKPP